MAYAISVGVTDNDFVYMIVLELRVELKILI